MYFKQLSLRDFRNYSALNLELHPGVNIFLGKNGQGKTNLLEAAYLLSHGQSFRPGSVDVFRRHQQSEYAPAAVVRGQIVRGNLQSEVRVQFQEGKKTFLLNEKHYSGSKLVRQFPSVLFSPESLAAIKEGPDHRRQLVDEFLLSHSLRDFKWVADYRKVLRTRNRLLRDFKRGIYSEPQVNELLEALDEIFLPTATALSHARIQALNVIEPMVNDAVRFISGNDSVDISVDYEISSQSAIDWTPEDVRQSLSNRLKLLRKSELDSGVSLVGPHKHDVHFLQQGKDSRFYASQGQQRAIILGFKMAQIMYHHRVFQVHPLLLLDDVLSELDPVKGANLLCFLEGIESQILLTTTDISFPFKFGDKGMAVFKLEQGKLESLSRL